MVGIKVGFTVIADIAAVHASCTMCKSAVNVQACFVTALWQLQSSCVIKIV